MTIDGLESGFHLIVFFLLLKHCLWPNEICEQPSRKLFCEELSEGIFKDYERKRGFY